MNKNKAIVLIFHHTGHLKWYEEISLLQCFRVLHHHPIRLVCPRDTDLSEFQAIVPEIIVEHVPNGWMSSLKRYNRMKILPKLYRKYSDYEFMLTYELDAFVFQDRLDHWCNSGYDYIGAPWIKPNSDSDATLTSTGVGNSGFSLRNIQSALRVMDSFCMLRSPSEVAKEVFNRGKPLSAVAKFFICATTYNTHWTINRSPFHDDRFWYYVGNRQAWFNLPSFESAAQFSFEDKPEKLFNMCEHQLPFGCHAWAKYDLDFWRPHIEAQGFKIP